MDDEHLTIEAIAYHEAGHAVMSYILKIPIKSATIIPDLDKTLGSVRISPILNEEELSFIDFDDWKTRYKIEREVMSSMAGKIAQAKYSGREINQIPFDLNQPDDTGLAGRLAELTRNGDELQAYYDYLYFRTANQLLSDSHWPLVEAVAIKLLKYKHLSGRTIRRVIQQTHMKIFKELRNAHSHIDSSLKD